MYNIHIYIYTYTVYIKRAHIDGTGVAWLCVFAELRQTKPIQAQRKAAIPLIAYPRCMNIDRYISFKKWVQSKHINTHKHYRQYDLMTCEASWICSPSKES